MRGVCYRALVLVMCVQYHVLAMDLPFVPPSFDPDVVLKSLDLAKPIEENIFFAQLLEANLFEEFRSCENLRTRMLTAYGPLFQDLVVRASCVLGCAGSQSKYGILVASTCVTGDQKTLLLLDTNGRLHGIALDEQREPWRVVCDNSLVCVSAIAASSQDQQACFCVTPFGLVYRLNPAQNQEIALPIRWWINQEACSIVPLATDHVLLSCDCSGVLRLWMRDGSDQSLEVVMPKIPRVIAYKAYPKDQVLFFCTSNGMLGKASVVPEGIQTKILAAVNQSVIDMTVLPPRGDVVLLTHEGDLSVYPIGSSDDYSKPISLAKCAKQAFLPLSAFTYSSTHSCLIGVQTDGTLVVWDAFASYQRRFYCNISSLLSHKIKFLHVLHDEYVLAVSQTGVAVRIPLLFFLKYATEAQLMFVAKLLVHKGYAQANLWHHSWRHVYHTLPKWLKDQLPVVF